MSNSYKLLVLPGDGIGPEVMKEVIKVAKSIGELSKVKFEIEEDDIGDLPMIAMAPLYLMRLLKKLKTLTQFYLVLWVEKNGII